MATKGVIGTPIFNRVEHAASRLGVSRSYLYREWITPGRVAVVKLGTRTLIPEDELQRVAAEILREANDPERLQQVQESLKEAGKRGAKGLAARREKDAEELAQAIAAVDERKLKMRK